MHGPRLSSCIKHMSPNTGFQIPRGGIYQSSLVLFHCSMELFHLLYKLIENSSSSGLDLQHCRLLDLTVTVRSRGICLCPFLVFTLFPPSPSLCPAVSSSLHLALSLWRTLCRQCLRITAPIPKRAPLRRETGSIEHLKHLPVHIQHLVKYYPSNA